VGLIATIAWVAAARHVAAADARRVVAVEIKGLRTIAQETCLARLQTRPGMTYDEATVSEDIRRLYNLGYFTDVQVATDTLPEGLRVTFIVEEKPTIGKIEVEGDLKFTKARILHLLGVKEGELLDSRKLKDGADQIKAEYRRKGYSRAEVATSSSVDPATHTATVYVVVDPGSRMRIKRIFIDGNLAYSDGRVLKLLKTKPKHLWHSGVYDEQVLEEDLERIRAFYRQHGYQDIEVDHAVSAAPTGPWLYVNIKINEGLQHRVGQVEVAGNQIVPNSELLGLLTLKPGAVYSNESLQADLRAIKQYYGDRGYINATVMPQTHLNEPTKLVDLTFKIDEHEMAYVNRIDIRGNLRTQDVVVRRELRIYPTEPFDGKKIRRSIERLYNLGFFEEVNVDTKPTSKPGHSDLLIDVKESKTGSFSFGGGFSSVDRVVGLVELEQRNFDFRNWPTFVGAGQDLRARVEVGTVRRYFDLSFTEPWFLGHPFSFGIDLYNRTRLRSSNLGLAFQERRTGGGLRFGKEVTENVRADVNYQLYRTVISDVDSAASADLKAEAGTNDISEIGTSLTWDTRDNKFDPTKGVSAFISGDLAGGVMGGNKDFYRFQSGISTFTPHFKRFVFEGRIRGGIVNEYGGNSSVPIFERFFAGGSNTIRGFRERRVGPRDPLSNDPIGGEAMLIGSLEEVMTLFSDEHGKPILKGSVFYDVGNVWRQAGDFGGSFESGVGVGMRVNTPIGPVRLDVGFPLTTLGGTERKRPRLHFNISRSF